MKTLPELVEKLKSIDPDMVGNAAAFETLLAEIVTLRTPDSIAPLLDLFRDNAQHDELMFSIIHSLEIFDDRVYVHQILRSSTAFCSKTPRWASIVFLRMLNPEPTRLELIRQLRDAEPDVKVIIKAMMEKINARSVKFLPKTVAILEAIS